MSIHSVIVLNKIINIIIVLLFCSQLMLLIGLYGARRILGKRFKRNMNLKEGGPDLRRLVDIYICHQEKGDDLNPDPQVQHHRREPVYDSHLPPLSSD